tara:strand:- start:470 stop:655 length:186 start_codon:yes stop_codon:yes gene_type:complete
MIKNGIANNGNDSVELIKRCITKLTGIESLIKRKYTIADAINENAMGIFNRNRTKRMRIGR